MSDEASILSKLGGVLDQPQSTDSRRDLAHELAESLLQQQPRPSQKDLITQMLLESFALLHVELAEHMRQSMAGLHFELLAQAGLQTHGPTPAAILEVNDDDGKQPGTSIQGGWTGTDGRWKYSCVAAPVFKATNPQTTPSAARRLITNQLARIGDLTLPWEAFHDEHWDVRDWWVIDLPPKPDQKSPPSSETKVLSAKAYALCALLPAGEDLTPNISDAIYGRLMSVDSRPAYPEVGDAVALSHGNSRVSCKIVHVIKSRVPSTEEQRRRLPAILRSRVPRTRHDWVDVVKQASISGLIDDVFIREAMVPTINGWARGLEILYLCTGDAVEQEMAVDLVHRQVVWTVERLTPIGQAVRVLKPRFLRCEVTMNPPPTPLRDDRGGEEALSRPLKFIMSLDKDRERARRAIFQADHEGPLLVQHLKGCPIRGFLQRAFEEGSDSDAHSLLRTFLDEQTKPNSVFGTKLVASADTLDRDIEWPIPVGSKIEWLQKP